MKSPSKRGGGVSGALRCSRDLLLLEQDRDNRHIVWGARGAEGQPQQDCDRPGKAQEYVCQKDALTSAASQQRDLAGEQKTADSGPPLPHLHLHSGEDW